MEKDLVWFITIGLLMTDIDLNSLEPERKKVDPVAMFCSFELLQSGKKKE